MTTVQTVAAAVAAGTAAALQNNISLYNILQLLMWYNILLYIQCVDALLSYRLRSSIFIAYFELYRMASLQYL